jgi:hypothetical protein
MRKNDILVLARIEEGVWPHVQEGMFVSDVCTDICNHMEIAMVHHVGDVEALTLHLTLVHDNRILLARLRSAGLRITPEDTWNAAGEKLL